MWLGGLGLFSTDGEIAHLWLNISSRCFHYFGPFVISHFLKFEEYPFVCIVLPSDFLMEKAVEGDSRDLFFSFCSRATCLSGGAFEYALLGRSCFYIHNPLLQSCIQEPFTGRLLCVNLCGGYVTLLETILNLVSLLVWMIFQRILYLSLIKSCTIFFWILIFWIVILQKYTLIVYYPVELSPSSLQEWGWRRGWRVYWEKHWTAFL